MDDERKKYLNEVCAKALGLKRQRYYGVLCYGRITKAGFYPLVPEVVIWNPYDDDAQCKMVQREFLEKRWDTVVIWIESVHETNLKKCYCMPSAPKMAMGGKGKIEREAILEAVAAEYEQIQNKEE